MTQWEMIRCPVVGLKVPASCSLIVKEHLVLSTGNERGIDRDLICKLDHLAYPPRQQCSSDHALPLGVDILNALVKQCL